MASMEAHFGTPIKQYPGQQQVDRAVVVAVPGKHFPFLSADQQKVSYDGTAVEYRERHTFERYVERHNKAWGVAHTGSPPPRRLPPMPPRRDRMTLACGRRPEPDLS